MLCKNKRVIIVATKTELLSEPYYRRLRIAARNIAISRRAWLDEIVACFRDYEGLLQYLSGQPYPIPFVDDVFGDDPDVRWMSDYLATDESGLSPRTIARKMERVQLIDLYFRIGHPLIARHFGR